MLRLIEGRTGRVLMGILLLALVAIPIIALIQLNQLSANIAESTASAYQWIVLTSLLAVGVIVALLLWMSSYRNSAPLKRLAATLEDGRAPDMESFASAGRDARDIAMLINGMAREEREISGEAATQQARLVSILDNLSVGVILLTENERALLINATAAQLFGFAHPLDGSPTLMELARDHEAAAIVRRALREETRAVGDITQAGERPRALRLVASPYRESGERRVLLAAYDVSEERRAQRLRHEFLANASHEIRTPLAGIQATLETLDMGAIDDPGAARPFVASALGEVQRLTTFVESLLDLSRLEMGWTRLALQPTDVGEAVNRCVAMMSSMASRANIELAVDVQQGLPEINADPGRLHQALVNLVHNAIKFTQPGGRVTVSASSMDGSIMLGVIDTGIGIPPDDLETLLDRIGQGDESGSRGGGLGLAIVKQIVEAHSGEVRAESNLGTGSTFSLRFPRAS